MLVVTLFDQWAPDTEAVIAWAILSLLGILLLTFRIAALPRAYFYGVDCNSDVVVNTSFVLADCTFRA